jgi:hypothetical protein
MHLDEEQVQRLLHGELASRLEAGVRAHLAGCAECGSRVAEAERDEKEIHALLRHLDQPLPPVGAREVAARARSHRPRWERWAAGIVLALGLGGASYAIPGSPVPALVKAVVHWAGGRTDRSPSAPAPAPEPTRAPDPAAAGIALAPGREFVIAFTSPLGQVRVSLTDAAEVVVRAPAGSATFTSHVDRLVIDNVGSAIFDVEIPRTAPRVEIRMNERRLFLKEGSRVTSEQPAESHGSYLVPLTPSGL